MPELLCFKQACLNYCFCVYVAYLLKSTRQARFQAFDANTNDTVSLELLPKPGERGFLSFKGFRSPYTALVRKDVRRLIKQAKTCVVKGVGPSVPHYLNLVVGCQSRREAKWLSATEQKCYLPTYLLVRAHSPPLVEQRRFQHGASCTLQLVASSNTYCTYAKTQYVLLR